MNTLTDRASQFAALQTKLQLADTLIATLQSQQQFLSASIQSLNFSSYGYSNTNSSLFSPSSSSSSSGG